MERAPLEKRIDIEDVIKAIKAEHQRPYITLFIPARTLHGVLRLGCLEKVKIDIIELSGFTKGSYRSFLSVTPPELQGFKTIRVRRFTKAVTEVLDGSLKSPTLNDLEIIEKATKQMNMEIYIKRLVVDIDGKKYTFKVKRPALGSWVSKVATSIEKQKPVYVLDLDKEHDLYRLKKIEAQLPNTLIRVCTIREFTEKEGVCQFIA